MSKDYLRNLRGDEGMFKCKKGVITIKTIAILGAITASAVTLSQEEKQLEEVIVVGSQIKGAAINTALPVTVITSEDIDILGLDSGEELLENMAEMGLNYFTEARLFLEALTQCAVILELITLGT